MNCPYCPHFCALKEGQRGLCGARVNQGGASVPRQPFAVSSLALDPIEKKPLYHFHPGTSILSVGGYGCNMACYFCQNHEISMGKAPEESRSLPPEELCALAESLVPRGNIGVAFTYNEPMVNFEYIAATVALLKEKGLKTAVITNGCFTAQALDKVLPVVDAYNIDLKGFTQGWYRQLGGDLETVKAFIAAAAMKVHVEVTTLIVPGKNDSEEEMEALSLWLASLSPDIPLHISRYFPRYKAQGNPTPRDTVHRLWGIARQHLTHVYMGNI